MLRRFTILATALSVLIGLITAVPAHAAAGVCESRMADTGPRWFDQHSTDTGDGQHGADTWGFIYVDKRSDGLGYNVCVDWGTAGNAVVYDADADGYGAAAYATYDQWNGSGWTHYSYFLIARADGYGTSTGYTFIPTKVKNFYMMACRIKSGYPHENCSSLG